MRDQTMRLRRTYMLNQRQSLSYVIILLIEVQVELIVIINMYTGTGHAQKKKKKYRPSPYAVTSSKRSNVPDGLVVRIRRSHRRGRGSIPRLGGNFYILYIMIDCKG